MTSNQVAAAVTALCGAASLACMFMVGRHQKSVMLILMFTVWVAAPFAAFLYLQLSAPSRAARAWLGVVIAMASVVIYAAVAFGPPMQQPAKFFLIVPSVSWVVLAAGWLLGRSKNHR